MLRMQARTVAPVHTVPTADLGQAQVAVPQAGVVLGRDHGGRPVRLDLFRPRPLSVVFIGGWWAVQVVALRCLGSGALILVDQAPSGPPVPAGSAAALGHWSTLDRAARGRIHAAAATGTALVPTDPVAPVTDAGQPLLRLHDPGPAGRSVRTAYGPWQTQLTAYSRLTPDSLAAATGADVVLVQRIEPAAAALLGAALSLVPPAVAGLATMDNEMLAAVQDQTVRYLWLAPTAVERQLFG